MTLKLKTLGLALVASLALSAMVASAASANTAVVTGGPNITGADSTAEGAKTELTGLAGVKCTTATYAGTAVESTITLTPSFSGCKASSGAPLTITVNGCAYKLTMGGMEGEGAPLKSAEIECPAGKSIEYHFYADAQHKVPACTINIGAQILTVSAVVRVRGFTFVIEGPLLAIVSSVSGHCVTTVPFSLPNDGPIPNPVASTLHTNIIVSGAGGLETVE